jgi:glyoxylase-like metal-dependent hydrolase (beta-lactamase superfamily II)
MKTFIHQASANTYIWCYKDQCLLIDPSDSYEQIRAYLEHKTLVAVVLTHAHADHMHLLSLFGKDIYLHEKDFPLLEVPKHIGYPKGFPYDIHLLNFIKMPDHFMLHDKRIDVIHTPGHSPGSICLKDDNNCVCGDVIFKESVGRTDLYLSQEKALKQSVLTLMTFSNDCVLYPGHGEKTTVRHEKSHNVFVKKWLK